MRPRALLARCETRCDATASDSPCCRGCRASRGGGGAITIGASDSFGFEKKWRAPVSFALAFRIRRIAEGFFSRLADTERELGTSLRCSAMAQQQKELAEGGRRRE